MNSAESAHKEFLQLPRKITKELKEWMKAPTSEECLDQVMSTLNEYKRLGGQVTNLRCTDPHESPVLHLVMRSGLKFEQCKVLLARLDPEDLSVHLVDKNEDTLLHVAVLESDLELARWLIENGADFHQGNKAGWLPLTLASLYKSVAIESYLMGVQQVMWERAELEQMMIQEAPRPLKNTSHHSKEGDAPEVDMVKKNKSRI